jgi:AraC family transcriptional regulator of adaptative response/methylated-DNA-[protein]-cysteine methyltransferase
VSIITQSASLERPGSAINPEAAWTQLLARDASASFFYAVVTTGVFCRPDCSSRRPLRKNVRFFRTMEEARTAGFRPCHRCQPARAASEGTLEKLRAYIEANLDHPVPLAELGRLAHLSLFTVQRLFKQALGVSPLQYQRSLRASSLRAALKQGASVTDAIYNAGFGSSSRGYDGAQLGMTPARFAAGGRGERIGWCTARTPFGWMIVGATERGLCWLSLAGSEKEAEGTLRAEFPAATLKGDPALGAMVEAALDVVAGQSNSTRTSALPQVDLRGTAFQLRVWQALRQIPAKRAATASWRARWARPAPPAPWPAPAP